MRGALALGTVALAAACASPSGRYEAVTLIKPEQGQQLMRQCSRTSPGAADSYFVPEPDEVTLIETAVMRALRDSRGAYASYIEQGSGNTTPFDWPDEPSTYHRQYLGFVVNGRRMIYGNYLPSNRSTPAAKPLIVCDGGPSFFGAQYDLDARQLIRIDFNGGRGGPLLEPIEP